MQKGLNSGLGNRVTNTYAKENSPRRLVKTTPLVADALNKTILLSLIQISFLNRSCLLDFSSFSSFLFCLPLLNTAAWFLTPLQENLKLNGSLSPER